MDTTVWGMPIDVAVGVIGGAFLLLTTAVNVAVTVLVHRSKQDLQRQHLELERTKADAEARKALYGAYPWREGEQRSETPDAFDQERGRYLKAIDEANTDIQARVYGLDDSSVDERASRFAEFHEVKARSLWPSSDLPSAYRCAYHYEISAHCFAMASNHVKAGWLAHFAGHKYRSLQEWEKAGYAYRRSADHFNVAAKAEHASRSARRAVACFREVEEHTIVAEIRAAFGLIDHPKA